MSTPPNDLLARLRELAAGSLKEQLRTHQRFLDLLGRLSTGDPGGERVREELARFSREHTAGYLEDLASLSLGYFRGLLDLNRSYNERFFSRVMEPEEPPPADMANGEAPHLAMSLRGVSGAEAKGSMMLENRQAEPAEVSFVVSPFTGPPGTSPFRVPVALEPARFALAPGEERRVTLTVPLLPDLFTPGASYRASVVVHGHEDLILDLEVTAEEAAAASPAPPAAAKKPRAPGPKRPAARAQREGGGHGKGSNPKTASGRAAGAAPRRGKPAPKR